MCVLDRCQWPKGCSYSGTVHEISAVCGVAVSGASRGYEGRGLHYKMGGA